MIKISEDSIYKMKGGFIMFDIHKGEVGYDSMFDIHKGEVKYDRMFDWNDDGKLDFYEQCNQYDFYSRADEENANSYDEEDELEEAGLDWFDLEMMDEDEHRDAIEEAGLDYDF